MRVSRFLIAVALVGSTLLDLPIARADLIVGGITFQDDAFSDEIIAVTDNVSHNGDSLEESILGSDLIHSIHFSSTSVSWIELGFTDNFVVNGAGYDLVLFELAIAEDFSVSLTVGGPTLFVPTESTGGVNDGGVGLNVAFVDLDDLNILTGDSIDSIVISWGTFGSGPDLAAVGALNSEPIPAPGAVLLAMIGLPLVGWVKRRLA